MKFYITTAIDYPNAKPHIGHALEKLYADTIARYKRIQGYDVFYLTGTDEHGVKNVRAAQKAGIPVAKFIDKNVEGFKELIGALNISNDYFIRTTNKKLHWPAVHKIWRAFEKNKDIYKKEYQGLYCAGHEAFVTRKDLDKNGSCVDHGTPPEPVKEENYFFKLSRYAKRVHGLIKSGKLEIIPSERKNEILKFLEKKVEDISFSRPRKDLKWGIVVPGDKTQTIYVWADALTNYISALGWGTASSAKFKKYWPADLHVIGKDILRFHAAYWPAMLLSAGLPLPKKIFVHGFISVEGKKMSKTLGNIIDPIKIVKQYSSADSPQVGTDALRYYLLSEISPTRDGDFSQEKFEARYNGDLALGVGNFLARITSLGEKYLKKPIDPDYGGIKTEIDKKFKAYEKAMDSFNFPLAVKQAQALVAYGDKKINDSKLWVLAREDEARFGVEIARVATILATVAQMLLPIIPSSAQKIFESIGIDPTSKKEWHFKFKKGKSLFPRLD